MNLYAKKLERAFVSFVVNKVTCNAEGREDALKAFAAQVWPEMDRKRAHEKIRLLTDGYPQKGGVPQRLTLGDAQRMAEALNTPLGYVVALADESVKRMDAGLPPL